MNTKLISRNAICFFSTIIIHQVIFCQSKVINYAMNNINWRVPPEKAVFEKYNQYESLVARNGGGIYVLKDVEFSKGTIEFDVDLENGGFVGINFRESPDKSLSEHFYIRALWPVEENSRTTLQYCTVYDSVSVWDLTDEYQAPARLFREGWNHIKLVVSTHQMKVYVNDMTTSALHVPFLEGELYNGGISLRGNAAFTNFSIKNNSYENLADEPGFDPSKYDSNYLTNWEYAPPIDFPQGIDLQNKDLPDSNTIWKVIRPEHRGVIMLNKLFGNADNGKRRFIWLKTTITADKEQERRLDLGFSDEVWIILNNDLLYLDKNTYGSLSMKEPKGRCTLRNSSVIVPLSKGENTILVGLANNFFGWGLTARFDKNTGLVY